MTCSVNSTDLYFANLNPLASKFAQDIEQIKLTIGDETWTDLSVKEREEIVDFHIIGSDISSKYEEYEQADEVVECFPRLMISPGEKIIVDFDNADGWTWRDEHSAPFSWETRSQLEMSFDLDDNDVDDAEETEKRDRNLAKVLTPKRPRTPERDPTLAVKVEKSIWESPFLTADRGLDSAYTSSPCGDQSKLVDNPNSSVEKGKPANIRPSSEKVKLISPAPVRPKCPPPPPPVQRLHDSVQPTSPEHVVRELKDKRWSTDRDVCEEDEQLSMEVAQEDIHGTQPYTGEEFTFDDASTEKYSDIASVEIDKPACEQNTNDDDDTTTSPVLDKTNISTGFDFLDNW